MVLNLPEEIRIKLVEIFLDERNQFLGKMKKDNVKKLISRAIIDKNESKLFHKNASKNKHTTMFNLLKYALEYYNNTAKEKLLIESFLNQGNKNVKKAELLIAELNDFLNQYQMSVCFDQDKDKYTIAKNIYLGRESKSYISDFIIKNAESLETDEEREDYILNLFYNIGKNSQEEIALYGGYKKFVFARVDFSNQKSHMNMVLKRMYSLKNVKNEYIDLGKEIKQFRSILKKDGYTIDQIGEFYEFFPTNELVLSKEDREEIFKDILQICEDFYDLAYKYLYRSFYKEKTCENPLGEENIQPIFAAVADSYCQYKYYNSNMAIKTRFKLDLNPEAFSGRGKVDFKVSNGGDKKDIGIIELKLSTHSDVLDCVRQIKEYCDDFKIKQGSIFIINFHGDDFDSKERDIEKLIEKMKPEYDIRLFVVDAIKKRPNSKKPKR